MSPPGFASVTPFILSQGAKGSGFNICFYLAFLLSPFILSQGEKRGDFNICLYLASPLSLHSSYGKVRKGVVLTYVSTWLSLCHVHLLAR